MDSNQNHAPEAVQLGAHGAELHDSENRLNEAFRQAQANLLRYQDLFDFAPDAYLVTDAKAIIQEANHAAVELFRIRKEFLVGKPLLFCVAVRDRREFTANLVHLTRTVGSQLQWEMCVGSNRQAPVCVLVTATTVRSFEHPVSFRWLLKDISHRRHLEQQLLAERDFSDTLVDLATAGILVLNSAGRIVRVNSYLCELTGTWRGELIDRTFADLLLPQDQWSAQHALDQLVVGNARALGSHRLLRKTGPPRILAWSARFLPDHECDTKHILIIGNDVTDLHEAQQRALQAERPAGIGQMAAGLAHESRNCLQRSQACLEMLAHRLRGQPQALQLLVRTQRAQDDLQRLFEGVREYASPIHLEMQRCQLADVWRQAWEDLAPVRVDANACLVEETTGVNLECLASPYRLKQVFRNLFENALAAGASRIAVRCTPAQLDERPALEVAVQDNGTGFSPEERRRAFADFFTTKVHGTGLGLAICKRILEAHGGRIVLSEPAGPGAVIVLKLPRRVP
jgi:PAS domain S-box-containing protein